MLATATEAKNNFGKYLKEVIDDKDVIITRNGERIARLTPYVTDVERYFTLRENAIDYEYGNKKISYDEFMEIYEKSSSRMEFINGEIFLLASPNIKHQELLGRLYLLFRGFFNEEKCRPFIAPFDVHFRKKNIKDPDVMQPDLFVACDVEGNINDKLKYMGTPTLVLEILSQSTKNRDMVYKLNTYMTSGVREYFIVDPIEERITVYTFEAYSIHKMEIYKKSEIAKSLVFEKLQISVDELFSQLLGT